MRKEKSLLNVLSIDVEDWFHILELKCGLAMDHWGHLPGRVEENCHRLLELFQRYQVHATCFVLGWIAERYPELVRTCACLGHELASHGYAHRLVYQMDREEFRRDLLRSIESLTQAAGEPPRGYRAPGTSRPWARTATSTAGKRRLCL